MKKVVTEKVILDEQDRQFLEKVDQFFENYCNSFDCCENCPLFVHDETPCGKERVNTAVSILLAQK